MLMSSLFTEISAYQSGLGSPPKSQYVFQGEKTDQRIYSNGGIKVKKSVY